jgi:hypothetical protein
MLMGLFSIGESPRVPKVDIKRRRSGRPCPGPLSAQLTGENEPVATSETRHLLRARTLHHEDPSALGRLAEGTA